MEQKNYANQHTSQKAFIAEVLNNSRPALVLFYDVWNDHVAPHLEILEKYKEKVPALPLYFFDMAQESNQDLAEALGVEYSPTFMIFKNNNMNRWLEPRKIKINNATILKFIGSPALYGVDKDEAKIIMDTFISQNTKAQKIQLKALKKLEEQTKKEKELLGTLDTKKSTKKGSENLNDPAWPEDKIPTIKNKVKVRPVGKTSTLNKIKTAITSKISKSNAAKKTIKKLKR